MSDATYTVRHTVYLDAQVAGVTGVVSSKTIDTIPTGAAGASIRLRTTTSHGLATGNSIVISGTNSTPVIDGTYAVTRFDADEFDITISAAVTGSGSAGTFSITTFTLATRRAVSHAFDMATGELLLLLTADYLTFTTGGDHDASACTLGRPYDWDVVLTFPYLRDQNGLPEMQGELNIQTITVMHKDTMEFTIAIEGPWSRTLTNRYFNSNGVGSFGFNTFGKTMVHVLSQAELTFMHFSNSSARPSTITGVEYDCALATPLRGVTNA